MIGMIKGQVVKTHPTHAIVDVNGVGYLVNCSVRTLSHISKVEDKEFVFWIETIVREDSIQLYGFLEDSEKDLFNILMSVQGVGAKAALNILAIGEPSFISDAIVTENVSVLNQAEGIGPKLSKRICNELKDKANLHALTGGGLQYKANVAETGIAQDVMSAMINLGYDKDTAASKVLLAQKTLDENATFVEMLKFCLNG